MNRFVLAIALACALSGTTMAGEIHTTGAPEPGDIHTTGGSSQGDVPSTDAPSPGEIPSTNLSVVLIILDMMF